MEFSIMIKSPLRDTLTLKLQGPRVTLRDIFLEVSIQLSISCNFFQLFYSGKKLANSLIDVTEVGIQTTGSTVFLQPNVRSGDFSSNFSELSPARQAIRTYAFGLNSETVKEFFNGVATLYIRIPVGSTFGTLTLQMNEPLSDDPEFYMQTFERIADTGESQRVHSLKKDLKTYQGKFNGDISAELFNSRGTPGRGVDTVVCILDNLLTTCGFN